MWQMVLANVSIKGWIIDSDIFGFFDGSCEVLVLSPHYVKIFYTDFVTRILKPLVGRSPHHVQNNQEFLKQLEDIKMGPDDIIISYDVKALFTSVPIKPALKIIQKLLEEDQTLPQRTTMTVNNITCLLEFCLTSTYFTFQEKFYEQVEGAAMGSPISPSLYGGLWNESLKHSTTTSIDVEKICWWHMHYHQSSSTTKFPEPHQLH